MGRPFCGCCRCNDPIVDIDVDTTACVQESTLIYGPTDAAGTFSRMPNTTATDVEITNVTVSHLTGYSTIAVDVTVHSVPTSFATNTDTFVIPTTGKSYDSTGRAEAWGWDSIKGHVNHRQTYASSVAANQAGFSFPGDAGAPSLGLALILEHSSGGASIKRFTAIGDCWQQETLSFGIGDSNEYDSLSTIWTTLTGGPQDAYQADQHVGTFYEQGTTKAMLAIVAGTGLGPFNSPTPGNYKLAIDVADLNVHRVRGTIGRTKIWLTKSSTFSVDLDGTSVTLSHTNTVPPQSQLLSHAPTSPSGWTGSTETYDRPDLSDYIVSDPGGTLPYPTAFWGETTVDGGNGVIGAVVKVEGSSMDHTIRFVIYGAGIHTFQAGNHSTDQDLGGYTYIQRGMFETGVLAGSGLYAIMDPSNVLFSGIIGVSTPFDTAWLRRLDTSTCDWGGDAYSSEYWYADGLTTSGPPQFGHRNWAIDAIFTGSAFAPPLVPDVGDTPQSFGMHLVNSFAYFSSNTDGHIGTVKIEVTP